MFFSFRAFFIQDPSWISILSQLGSIFPPRRSQDGAKSASGRHQERQDAARDRPRRLQDVPKTSQDAPKTPPSRIFSELLLSKMRPQRCPEARGSILEATNRSRVAQSPSRLRFFTIFAWIFSIFCCSLAINLLRWRCDRRGIQKRAGQYFWNQELPKTIPGPLQTWIFHNFCKDFF